MISILSRIFIKDRENFTNPKVRREYGMLCSIVGVILNLLVFAGKYAAGVISGSIAITADAFNNLSDGGSSLIALVGFRFSGMKPDRDHPFGHGRIEYVSGFVVSMLIILMGFELGKSSVQKIFAPEPIQVSMLSVVILLVSIAVKLYMYYFNKTVGKKIDSETMLAAAKDSFSDVFATSTVLISMAVSYFWDINIDAWCGIVVAAFILKAGYDAASDTLSPLLGKAPKPEFVREIYTIVMAHDAIIGIHDLVVHDYGPGRVMISLHGEVSEDGDLREIHEQIDHIERELSEQLGCEAVMHMDPIAVNDESVSLMRDAVAALVLQIDERMSIHDFRVVKGNRNTNLIFDAVIPIDGAISESEAREAIEAAVLEKLEGCTAVVHIDKSYTDLV